MTIVQLTIIEEHFQRKNGFYWLNQFLVFFELDELSNVAINKYQEILLEYPMLPDTNYFNFNGLAKKLIKHKLEVKKIIKS